MGSTKAILAVALLIILLGTPSVVLATDGNNSSSAYMLKPEAKGELIAFVNEAKNFVLTEGKDKAMQVFNDPKGKFVRGELYIIAYDFNGTCLAHPYEPQMVGKNVLNVTDSNGVALKMNMRDVAKRGDGFTYYVWPNPAHSNAPELKLTYVLKIDESSWLGAGVYLPGQVPIINKTVKDDLVAFVKKASDFALNNTKEVALKAFNDKNGEFVIGNRYIYAYDFKGNNLALPFEQELVGTNLSELQDPNGIYQVQELSDVAKRGDGFGYHIYKDPADNMTPKLKVDYVMKVNDEWFLGSGIYWPEA